MYVRYQGTYNSVRTDKPCGIFAVVSHMREKGLLSRQETEEVQHIVDWFEKHLPNPPFYKEDTPPKATTWFKRAVSTEMIAKIERIKAIVETNGWQIDIECHQEVRTKSFTRTTIRLLLHEGTNLVGRIRVA